MGKMPYCRKCGAELPKDARFCPACGTPIVAAEAKPVETHRTLKVTGKPKVVVTNTAPGSVEVKTGPEAEVTVGLDLRRPEDLDWDILQDGNTVTITCRSRVPSVFSWPMHFFSAGPRANIIVSVPKEADVDLENRIGGIVVSGVKGTLEVDSATGKVSMQDCEGTVKARTRTGSVNLENVNGTVYVRNSTGSIRFSGVLSKGENWFRTSTGSIELMLRGEPNLTVEASTTLGRVTCSPELAEARFARGVHTGRIGAGTGKLIAETKTGNIRISKMS
jgi:DUF4097 and DUF4098 domain-containing protein YvlB